MDLLGTSLTRSGGVERLQNDIYDPLRGEDISSAHRSRARWCEEGFLRNPDYSRVQSQLRASSERLVMEELTIQRDEASRIERNV